MRGILPFGFWAKARSKTKEPEQPKVSSYFPFPPLIRSIVANLSRDLERIHYLGPLRSPAKRYYMTNMESVPSMDASGDFLPYVLRDLREQVVAYVPPRTQPKPGLQPMHRPLYVALDEWMHYIRTGDRRQEGQRLKEIEVSSTKDVLLEFTLNSPMLFKIAHLPLGRSLEDDSRARYDFGL